MTSPVARLDKSESISDKRIIVRIFASLLLISTLACGSHRVPAYELAAGLKTVDWMENSYGLDYNARATEPVKQVMGRLLRSASEMNRGPGYKSISIPNPEEFPWEIYVVKDPRANAFSSAPGFIFVTYGLIAETNSEAELAAVIAHELSHVLLGHTSAAMKQSAGRAFHFSQDQELDADELGIAIMGSAGYGGDSALAALMSSRRSLLSPEVADRETAIYRSLDGKPCPIYTAVESRQFNLLRKYVSEKIQG